MGYSGVESAENRAPLMGAMFLPISGASSYDLRECKIIGDGEYCDPGGEFLRVLNPNSLANTARYTYVSKEWMIDNFNDDSEEYLAQFAWAIGWWSYDPDADYQEIIEDDNDDTNPLRVTSAINIGVGTAFIGNFSNAHSLRLVSNGGVPVTSTAIATGENRAPMIANIRPVATSLFNMTISGEDGSGEYCDPGGEFLRVLNPNSLANAARYTYVSREWMEDNFNDDSPEYLAQFEWAIGWWTYDPDVDYQEMIEDDNDPTNPLHLTVDVPIPAGMGFIGNFSNAHSLNVNFPGVVVD